MSSCDRLKSSNLVNTALTGHTSLLTNKNSQLNSSQSLLSKPPTGQYTNLSYNGKKKSDLESSMDIKKSKLTNLLETSLSSSLLLNSKYKSHVTSLADSLTLKIQLRSTNSLLSPKVNLKSHLLSTKVSSYDMTKTSLLTNQILSSSIQNNAFAKKRSYEELDIEKEDTETVDLDSEFAISVVQEEFLQVDQLIEFINEQQNSQREFLTKAKRMKASKIETIFLDNALMMNKAGLTSLQRSKNFLIDLVSSSLLHAPNFKDIKDKTRLALLRAAESVIDTDPEFILKLALYTRRELNIRVTANFLLCLAAFNENCRPFITRYFKASIVVIEFGYSLAGILKWL